ncbi:type VI secretion system tube protein TssD [Olleya sp. ITB9]|uniref:type VI secretion system tube protein TssD n=1 Tax=Olleya sp. ITB9 TaxID=1715648 RepID=UPI0006D1D329|nr:type VI secretion system tube protein TssD [Olleya sp. ITB9]
MSITAKLYVEDRVFNILNFNFSFNQQSSMSGLPSAKPTGGQFDIVLEATKDPIFYEWMTSNSLMNKVKIEISQSFTFGKTRQIELIDVYCLLHQDTFNGVNNQPMQTLIKLSPAILLQNGEKMFECYWKVTDLDAEVEETVVNNELEFVNYYITDIENNEIEEYHTGDKILLNIETKNAIGEKITLSIEDKTQDFKYNGAVLENDTLKDYIINSDLEQVELEVIEQQE